MTKSFAFWYAFKYKGLSGFAGSAVIVLAQNLKQMFLDIFFHIQNVNCELVTVVVFVMLKRLFL